jgi:hypothetical protein
MEMEREIHLRRLDSIALGGKEDEREWWALGTPQTNQGFGMKSAKRCKNLSKYSGWWHQVMELHTSVQ